MRNLMADPFLSDNDVANRTANRIEELQTRLDYLTEMIIPTHTARNSVVMAQLKAIRDALMLYKKGKML